MSIAGSILHYFLGFVVMFWDLCNILLCYIYSGYTCEYEWDLRIKFKFIKIKSEIFKKSPKIT